MTEDRPNTNQITKASRLANLLPKGNAKRFRRQVFHRDFHGFSKLSWFHISLMFQRCLEEPCLKCHYEVFHLHFQHHLCCKNAALIIDTLEHHIIIITDTSCSS